ncbi:hypothetical protein [Candidatus Accumulibacter sp. ACC003]|uniref:hypothetical protein n=1 Tax=Candidatus Accumulibacter sp. ACC003 TaxID=2823334 RepID=UPI0025C1D6F3|nr:hypothetical protein [Candidatus Accumulibacter sp. ACC003]
MLQRNDSISPSRRGRAVTDGRAASICSVSAVYLERPACAYGAQRRRRQHLDQQGQDALDFFVAAAKVLGPVEIRNEELRGATEARAGEQVGVRSRQSGRLPFAEQQPLARRRRVEIDSRPQAPGGLQVPTQCFDVLLFFDRAGRIRPWQ